MEKDIFSGRGVAATMTGSKIYRALLISSACLALSLLNACSGGGNDQGSGTPLQVPDLPSGKFLYGEVVGLQYTTDVHDDNPDSGVLEGVIDKEYGFYYNPGLDVSFSIGGIDLGNTDGKKNITPLDLAPESSDVEGKYSYAVNMCRFIMSIDDDGDSENGVAVNKVTREALAEASLDFSSASFEIEAEAIIESLSEEGDISPEDSEGQPRGLTSTRNAELFLEDALAAIEAEENPSFSAVITPYSSIILVQGQTVTIGYSVSGSIGAVSATWKICDEKTYPQGVISVDDPGAYLKGLTPGTYILGLTAVDTADGTVKQDFRYITVLSSFTIPAEDKPVFISLDNITGRTNFFVGETLEIKATLLGNYSGNPPFYYHWSYPDSVGYEFDVDPLYGKFTFSEPGEFTISFYIEDTPFGGNYKDSDTRNIKVTVQ